MTPEQLLEFAGQEACELDHLAKPVIADYARAKSWASTPELAFNHLTVEYFANSKFGRLWLLSCLYKLEQLELEDEADRIEGEAARRAYDAELGAGEWESFLTPEQTRRLIELADMGHGTWANEPSSLAAAKERVKE